MGPGDPGAGTVNLADRVRAAFAPGGPLARAVSGFEVRPAQVQMAAAVAAAIERRRTLLVESPTGGGKSLAALMPLALHLLEGNGRAVYSTATITLQEQLLTKDIPTVQRVAGGPQAALLKGMARYLCLLKWGMSRERLLPQATPEGLQRFAAWVAHTTTGDQNELPEVPAWWGEVGADPADCLGAACSHALTCFALRAKERARSAPLLAVNHHLLLLYKRFGSQAIPDDAPIVIDESHHLADIASDVWGSSFTDHTFRALVQRLHGLAPDGRDPLHADLQRAQASHDAFVAPLHPTGEEPAPLPALRPAVVETYLGMLNRVADKIRARQWDIFRDRTGTSANDRAAILLRMLEGYGRTVEAVFKPGEGVASWVEPVRGRDVSAMFRTAPIEVGGVLGALFSGEAPARVLMSATLATNGSFAHTKTQLGLRGVDELILPPAFDYAQQMRYYLPASPLDPTAPEFTAFVTNELLGLLRASQGRALVHCNN